ncbi:MAG TPA: HD domain-containing protein [Dehalococcoidia bacterium]|nr:HD domain-containing protein [Dehalococcoidia bacterium]
MSKKLNRDEVLDSIRVNVQDKNMVRHMLATEAIMCALARKLGEDEDEWGFTGLLHDIDVELVGDDASSHSKLGADIAQELGASEKIAHAILCHNEAHGIPRETKLERALFCADPLSGLITAAALVRPDKLSGLTTKSVMKRFKEKRFAAGISREQVAQCQQIGLELKEFITLGLEAMRGIASRLEL